MLFKILTARAIKAKKSSEAATRSRPVLLDTNLANDPAGCFRVSPTSSEEETAPYPEAL